MRAGTKLSGLIMKDLAFVPKIFRKSSLSYFYFKSTGANPGLFLLKKNAGKYDLDISEFQCNRNSLGWIDENGTQIIIPDKNNDGSVSHNSFIFESLNKDGEAYIEKMKHIEKSWVRVSNMNEISSYKFPSAVQLESFAIIHYICTRNCKISPMNSIDGVIRIYIESEDRFQEMPIYKLIDKYGGEELESLYYDL